MSTEFTAQCIHIEKKYGSNHVLGPISVAFLPGTATGIRGENGAGKSTLLQVLAGVLKPDSGEVRTSGRVGYVPQEISLYPALSCRDNLRFWAGVCGISGKKLRSAVEAALQMVGLEEQAGKKLEACSGGMKRRLNLAAALLRPCDLLLLDEPTAGCDARSVEIILRLVRELKERGTAVVLISHEERELDAVCDRVLTLDHGAIADIKIRKPSDRTAENPNP